MCSLRSVALIIIFLTLPLGGNAQKRGGNAQERSDDLPTPVRSGRFSIADREYSKVLKPSYSAFTLLMSPYLSSLAAQTLEQHQTETSNELLPGSSIHLKTKSSEPQEFIDRLSCGADVVVRGTVVRRESRMLDDESFIYTTYDFSATETFKNNTKKKIDKSRPITVARPGGRIKLNGVAIRLSDSYYPPFVTDSEYILFLKYVPLADGFVLSDGDGDFVFDRDPRGNVSNYTQLGASVQYTSLPNHGSTSDLIDLIRHQPKRCVSPNSK